MRKSKLESYEDILRVLVKRPMTVDGIAYAIGTNCVLVNQRLDFMIKTALVEQTTYKKKRFYAVTRRGAAVWIIRFPLASVTNAELSVMVFAEST